MAAGKSEKEVKQLAAKYRPELEYALYDKIQPIFVKKLKEETDEEEEPLYQKSKWELALEQKFGNHLRQDGREYVLEKKFRYSFVSNPDFAGKVQKMRQLLSGKLRGGGSLEEIFMDSPLFTDQAQPGWRAFSNSIDKESV